MVDEFEGHGDVPTCSEGSLHLGHDLEGVPADAALSEGHDMFGSFDLCPHEISTVTCPDWCGWRELTYLCLVCGVVKHDDVSN